MIHQRMVTMFVFCFLNCVTLSCQAAHDMSLCRRKRDVALIYCDHVCTNKTEVVDWEGGLVWCTTATINRIKPDVGVVVVLCVCTSG